MIPVLLLIRLQYALHVRCWVNLNDSIGFEVVIVVFTGILVLQSARISWQRNLLALRIVYNGITVIRCERVLACAVKGYLAISSVRILT